MIKLFVYMMITNDEYELPLAVADTVKELSEIINVSSNAIRSAISHKPKKCIYVKVDIGDADDSIL